MNTEVFHLRFIFSDHTGFVLWKLFHIYCIIFHKSFHETLALTELSIYINGTKYILHFGK